LSIGAACAVGLCDDPGLDALAGVLRSSSARSRSINGTERSERRRAAIRALQPHRGNARFAAGRYSRPAVNLASLIRVPETQSTFHSPAQQNVFRRRDARQKSRSFDAGFIKEP